MKNCTYCGKEYPDEATVCVFDDEPLGKMGANGVVEAPAPIEPVSNTSARDEANRNMLVGGILCGGGILVTAMTMAASSGPGGGPYIVAWGAILFGGIRFIRGVLAR
jgi:hypothetical protein